MKMEKFFLNSKEVEKSLVLESKTLSVNLKSPLFLQPWEILSFFNQWKHREYVSSNPKCFACIW